MSTTSNSIQVEQPARARRIIRRDVPMSRDMALATLLVGDVPANSAAIRQILCERTLGDFKADDGRLLYWHTPFKRAAPLREALRVRWATMSSCPLSPTQEAACVRQLRVMCTKALERLLWRKQQEHITHDAQPISQRRADATKHRGVDLRALQASRASAPFPVRLFTDSHKILWHVYRTGAQQPDGFFLCILVRADMSPWQWGSPTPLTPVLIDPYAGVVHGFSDGPDRRRIMPVSARPMERHELARVGLARLVYEESSIRARMQREDGDEHRNHDSDN